MRNNKLVFSGRGKCIPHSNEYEELHRILSDNINEEEHNYYHFGYECLGPLLYGFSIWLLEKCRLLNIKKILFLSRDGYLIKKAFDSINSSESIDSKYLYISRRSIHFPLLHKYKKLYDFLSLNGERKRWSYTTLCSRLCIDPIEYEQWWEECGLSIDLTFKLEEINRIPGLEKFYEHIYIKQWKLSQSEYILITEYLDIKGSAGDFAIVDSGGIGTIQTCINKIIQFEHLKTSIIGFYFWNYGSIRPEIYVYPTNSEDSFVGGETVLTEIPLSAHEGSVISYCKKDGSIFPILDNYEYNNESNIDNLIYEIQKGCMDSVHILSANFNKEGISREVAYYNCKMASRYPRLFEIKLFGEWFFHSDQEDTFLAHPKSLLYHITHLSECKREFSLTRWKIGYLKALLKLPFPYYDVLVTLKKILSYE